MIRSSEMTLVAEFEEETKKRPDVTLKLHGEDKPLVVMDYKGPNCIKVRELEKGKPSFLSSFESFPER